MLFVAVGALPLDIIFAATEKSGGRVYPWVGVASAPVEESFRS